MKWINILQQRNTMKMGNLEEQMLLLNKLFLATEVNRKVRDWSSSLLTHFLKQDHTTQQQFNLKIL